ncbi:hypothetical protein GCM10011297_24690 [Bacterioplanes sanyensis]|uniref:DUF6471 domain-containing protein n=1 Tax=Bacterioplanes sanyensis TaxID=1249553 RepID=UPI001672E156|nr:DUF6471 domain-containing protein [Bacterioplanes sanyensis]GGY50868.1 hypothetical protein GCM10011297_24690 [Bacterioplanes sanyensis]
MKPEQSAQNKRSLAQYRMAISRLIRSSMILKSKRYEDLALELEQRGIVLTSENLRSKVSKGAFAADLFLVVVDILDMNDEALQQIQKLQREQDTTDNP